MPSPTGNINKIPARPRILVAPLDWGLGHATRCIPLVRSLLKEGADVFLAGEGAIAKLLATEFPELPILPLPGYRITYSRQPRFLTWHLCRQIPRILLTIRREHQWLLEMQKEYRFDGIISDNRYGLYLSNIPSVILTHQLQIETGKKRLNAWAARINLRLIRRFREVWVPDTDGPDRLAGSLSVRPKNTRMPVTYLGPLSRFSESINPKQSPWLILLSGPEPQRSLFEKQMLEWIVREKLTATMVLGKPGAEIATSAVPGVTIHAHLPADQLNALILGAKTIMSRGGYSSIMDFAMLHRKAVLVPTPGQSEQEYLAHYLDQKKWFACIRQEELTQYTADDIQNLVEGLEPWQAQSRLDETVVNWLKKWVATT